MCAVAVPEVRFTNVPERTQIDVGRIPLQRLKLVSRKTSFLPHKSVLIYFLNISINTHIPKIIFSLSFISIFFFLQPKLTYL